MSVGIMDADMASYIMVPFNLECMKLSAYYKKHREIVVLAQQFAPERHSKFLYRKDYDDGEYPLGLTTSNNVDYGGLAFTNNIYQPLPDEIEKMRPDPTLYAPMEKIILNQRASDKKTVFTSMINAEHMRLSLDGSHIWCDYPKQFTCLATARLLMLHDYDLGAVEGSFEEITKILARARTDGWATKIGMKFPLNIYTGDDLLRWTSLNPHSVFYSLRYNGIIPNEAFTEWIGRCGHRALYTQMEYYITPRGMNEEQLTQTYLPQILRQTLISRSYRQFFTLKYDQGFFSDPMWESVIQLFNCYNHSMRNKASSVYFSKVPTDTIFDFCAASRVELSRYYGEYGLNRQKLREIFAFVQEHNYPLFKDFYECSATSLGGKLI